MNNNFAYEGKMESIDLAFERHQHDNYDLELTDKKMDGNDNKLQDGTGASNEDDGAQVAAQLAAEIQLQQQQNDQRLNEEKLKGAGGPIRTKIGSSQPMRIVSTTKRAAQNRNAQKAFRQRKEKYIKDLETTAAQVEILKQTVEDLKTENLQLRDYTLSLQSKVLELSGSHETDLTGGPTPPVFNKTFDK